MKRLALLLLVAGSVGAQTANVIGIDTVDADRARAAWTALQKAQADWASINSEISKKYLTARPNESYSACLNGSFRVRSGWECGEIDFSSDFRHIVPKQAQPLPNCGSFHINPVRNLKPSESHMHVRPSGYDSVKVVN